MKYLVTALMVLVATPALAQRPDIIVFYADDMGAADAGPVARRPGVITPNIDALAREGVSYTHAYGQPACVPARTALMTGLYPQRAAAGSVYANGPQPPGAIITVAERLEWSGYLTFLTGKWHLGFGTGAHPLEQGFEKFFGYKGITPDYVGDDPDVPLYRQREEVGNTGLVTYRLGNEVLRILAQPHKAPRFIYLAFTAPHDPLQGSFAQRVLEMDTVIGQVRAAAKPGTLFIYMGDNGRGANNAPLKGRKYDIWEGGVRVPLVVSWPGFMPEDTEVTTPASVVDVTATILEAANLPREGLDGRDLRYLPENRALFFKAFTPDPGYAVRRGQWKYYWNYQGKEHRLYYVTTDLDESTDLSEENPGVVAELRELLQPFVDATPPTVAKKR